MDNTEDFFTSRQHPAAVNLSISAAKHHYSLRSRGKLYYFASTFTEGPKKTGECLVAISCNINT